MAKNVNVAEIFQMMKEANDEIAALKEQVRTKEKLVEQMEQQLMTSIPANQVKNGVQHIVTFRTSVAYAQALTKITETLVPKTKAAEVAHIVSEFSKVSEQHKFKAV